jgi:hypothetical protein
MIQKNFEQVWNQLRGKGNVQSDFLTNITITNFRGIRDLSGMFRFPVSVLAGASLKCLFLCRLPFCPLHACWNEMCSP